VVGLSKPEAGYLDACPAGRLPCRECEAFDPYMLTCPRVAGSVLAVATCDLFSRPAPPVLEEPDADEPERHKVPGWGSKNW
jgi:hypothetical protein